MAIALFRIISAHKFVSNPLIYSHFRLRKPTVYQSSRKIMTTSVRAKKLLESLKDNPYFDKYAVAITKLQQTNPEEFISRIEEKENNLKVKKAQEKSFRGETSAKPSSSPTTQRIPPKLSDVMKLDLLEDKVADKFGLKSGFLGFKKSFRCAAPTKTFARHYSDHRPSRIYVTTPIFYVNAGPHIGHLYSAALADAVARYNSMLGHDVFYSTGTDEHGNKVQNAAEMNKQPVQVYCDKISGLFRGMCQDFDVNYTNFIRTTDPHHQQAVQHFWTKLRETENIYLGKYSGWYCVSDEAFVSNLELGERKNAAGETIKVSSASGQPVEWMEEKNYKFRLSAFQNDLKHWLKDENSVQPAKYHRILSNWIEEGACLEDLSVSRPASRVPWGISVPHDDSQTIYVWLDALINYLSTLGYPEKQLDFWPPSIQVVGKDILKFHGIYWPAFLIAAGMEPPKTILCHSHWLVNAEKMSKSRGNVVSPSEAAKTFTPDGLRYFLLREAVPHSDANYSEEKIRQTLNSELADTLGNLVSRCMGKTNPEGLIPEPLSTHCEVLRSEEAVKLVETLQTTAKRAQDSYKNFNLHLVADTAMQTLFAANKMVEHHKPWVLVKQSVENAEAKAQLEAVLALGLEAARISALVLLPIIPRLASGLLDSLCVPANARMWRNCAFLNTGRTNAKVRTERKIFFRKLQ